MTVDHLSTRTQRRLARSAFAPAPDQQELLVAELSTRVLADRTTNRPLAPVTSRYVCPNCNGPHPRDRCPGGSRAQN
jgi:hypothetical protein